MHDAITEKFFTRRTLIKLAGFAMAVPLAGCSRTYRWRQKLTVTVATPSGDKSGSSVTEVKAKLTNSLGAGPGGAMAYRGEAAVVDLGENKYLFALLSEQTNGYAEFVFRPGDTESSEAFWGRVEASIGKVGSMPADRYPMLVTFGDLNDPKSVKEVKPSDLAASFGPGYALKSITLEITDEPVTEGVVDKVLPWLFTLHTRLIPTDKKYAKDFLPIENVGPEHFLFPFRKENK